MLAELTRALENAVNTFRKQNTEPVPGALFTGRSVLTSDVLRFEALLQELPRREAPLSALDYQSLEAEVARRQKERRERPYDVNDQRPYSEQEAYFAVKDGERMMLHKLRVCVRGTDCRELSWVEVTREMEIVSVAKVIAPRDCASIPSNYDNEDFNGRPVRGCLLLLLRPGAHVTCTAAVVDYLHCFWIDPWPRADCAGQISIYPQPGSKFVLPYQVRTDLHLPENDRKVETGFLGLKTFELPKEGIRARIAVQAGSCTVLNQGAKDFQLVLQLE